MPGLWPISSALVAESGRSRTTATSSAGRPGVDAVVERGVRAGRRARRPPAPRLAGARGGRAGHGGEGADVVAQPPPRGNRVAPSPLVQRACRVRHPVGPRRLRVAQEHQLALRRREGLRHAVSLPVRAPARQVGRFAAPRMGTRWATPPDYRGTSA